MKQLLFFLIPLLFITTGITAQDNKSDDIPKSKIVIKTKDDKEYYGTIKEDNGTVIILQTSKGEKSIDKTDIESIDDLNYNGKYDFPNPHSATYFRGDIGTGIPLRKGKGYLQSSLSGVGTFTYGLTDYFSIGGGLSPALLILRTPNITVSPKFAHSFNELLHVGVGVTYSYAYSNFFRSNVKAHAHTLLSYTAFTVGNTDSNISLGLGYEFSYASGSVNYDSIQRSSSANGSLLASLSGSLRLTEYLSLISENYIRRANISDDGWDDEINIVYDWLHGIRIHKKRNVFDIGFRYVPGLFFTPVIPFLGYVRTFGKP